MNVDFKPIPSLNNEYFISEDGKQFFWERTGKIRKLDRNDSGYVTVSICNKRLGYSKKRFYVAYLVADAWIGRKPEGYQIDHIDRNKNNNHYKNLRYVSPSTNVQNSKHRGAVPVSLEKDKKVWDFTSMTDAAKFIESQTGKTREIPKLIAGRPCVYGYEVVYADNRAIQQLRQQVIQLSLF